MHVVFVVDKGVLHEFILLVLWIKSVRIIPPVLHMFKSSATDAKYENSLSLSLSVCKPQYHSDTGCSVYL